MHSPPKKHHENEVVDVDRWFDVKQLPAACVEIIIFLWPRAMFPIIWPENQQFSLMVGRWFDFPNLKLTPLQGTLVQFHG